MKLLKEIEWAYIRAIAVEAAVLLFNNLKQLNNLGRVII